MHTQHNFHHFLTLHLFRVMRMRVLKKGLIHSAGEKKVSIMTTLENLSICPQSEDGKKMYAFPSREFSSSHQTLSRNLINNHRISVGTGLAGRNLMIKGDAATKKK